MSQGVPDRSKYEKKIIGLLDSDLIPNLLDEKAAPTLAITLGGNNRRAATPPAAGIVPSLSLGAVVNGSPAGSAAYAGTLERGPVTIEGILTVREADAGELWRTVSGITAGVCSRWGVMTGSEPCNYVYSTLALLRAERSGTMMRYWFTVTGWGLFRVPQTEILYTQGNDPLTNEGGVLLEGG